MKKTFAFLGSILYSLFLSLIIYFAFSYISGWILSLSWMGFILYMMFGSSLIIGLVLALSSAMSMPLISMSIVYNKAKWIPLVLFLVYGIKSCIVPWTINCDSGLLRVFECLSIDVFSETIFVSLIFILIRGEKLE